MEGEQESRGGGQIGAFHARMRALNARMTIRFTNIVSHHAP